MMRRLALTVGLGLLGAHSMFGVETGAPAVGLKLTEVVKTVVDRNPAVKGFAAQAERARYGLSEVRAGSWPSLSIRSAVTRGDNPVYAFASLLEQQRFREQNFQINKLNQPDNITNIKNALILGVPLFMGLERQSQAKVGEILSEQAQTALSLSGQRARLEAVDAFLQVLLHRDLLAAVETRLSSSHEELESARKLRAKGLVLGSDYFAALAIYSGMVAQKTQARKALDAAVERLSILTGRDIAPRALAGRLDGTPYPVPSKEALITHALHQRSELKQADSQSAIAEVGYRQSGRGFWPKIDAFAAVETNTEDFSSNPSNRMIGLRSHFPIGDPAFFSRKAKARAELDEALNFKQSAEEQIRIDVTQTYRRYEGAVESLSITKDMVDQMGKSLELFRPLYREGRQSIIEVMRAEEGLMRAQSSYLQTLYEVHGGFARLKFAAGEMDDEVVRELERHLDAL